MTPESLGAIGRLMHDKIPDGCSFCVLLFDNPDENGVHHMGQIISGGPVAGQYRSIPVAMDLLRKFEQGGMRV